MLLTRDSLRVRHTQTESQRMEKDISCKLKRQENRGSDIHIGQNNL